VWLQFKWKDKVLSRTAHILNPFNFVHEMFGWEAVYVKVIIILDIAYSITLVDLQLDAQNFVYQVGDQPRLYYDARSTNHQDLQC
jgi:hypothetical protein